MSKQNKNHPKKTPAIQVTSKASNKKSSAGSLLESMDAYFEKNRRFFLYLILGLSVAFSFLCFDTKISTANDDALYIEAGANYAKTFFGYFYTGNAPLYPMILGVLIKIFGMKLLLLKSFSILFFTLGLLLVYRSFEKRIPYSVLIPALLITAINFPFLMYSSLTYSENFSFLVFALGFYVVYQFLQKSEADPAKTDLQQWYAWILIAAVFFVQMLTRNVAMIAIGVLLIYLIYRKRYIGAGITTVAWGIFFACYKLSLKYVWHMTTSQFSYQSQRMFQKDAYNPQLGNETVSGFFVRFWQNCQIYFSSRLYYVLGFREELSVNILLLTVVTMALLIWSFIIMYKNKQQVLLFSTLFFAALLGITFISLQTSWGQSRLIMIYLPFILFAFFYLLYYYGTQYSFLQYLLPFFIFVLLTSNLTATFKNIKLRFPVFLENINGDPTYGFSPDWQNYIRMSVWCKDNLPDSTMVAVRKPPMSYIFSGGKEFYGIYNVPYFDADSLLTPLRNAKVEYIMLSELRLDPNRYIENQYINTVHRYASYIVQKYPDAFQFVHQEGEIERSALFKINYAYIDSMKNALATTSSLPPK